MAFIKFILWIALIYFFFKLVFQGLSKYLMYKIKQQQEKFGQQFGADGANPFEEILRRQQQAQQQNSTAQGFDNDTKAKEGETVVIKPENPSKDAQKTSKELGEYIDYEEA